MLEYIFNFLGLEFDPLLSPDVLSVVLPVVICVAAVLSFYILVSFLQFILKIIDRR